MPVGFAASLPLPQGPLSPFSIARHSPRFQSSATPAGAGRRLPIPAVAHDDPPFGRLLLVHNDTALALKLQRLLLELGWRVLGPAASAAEVDRLLERQRALPQRIDAAVVGTGLLSFSAIADGLADQGIGVVWLASEPDPALPPRHAHAPVVSQPFDRDAWMAALDEATKRQPPRWQYPVPPPQSAWPRVFPQL